MSNELDYAAFSFDRAARLWRQGMSTAAIALHLRVKEADVYNRLDGIKAEASRQNAARGPEWRGGIANDGRSNPC